MRGRLEQDQEELQDGKDRQRQLWREAQDRYRAKRKGDKEFDRNRQERFKRYYSKDLDRYRQRTRESYRSNSIYTVNEIIHRFKTGEIGIDDAVQQCRKFLIGSDARKPKGRPRIS